MSQKKRNLRPLRFLIIITIGILIFLFARSTINNLQNTPNTQNISIKLDPQTKSSFTVLKNGFAGVGKTSVDYYNFKGEKLWSQNTNFEHPQIFSSELAFLVCDMKGKSAKVFNEDGLLYDISIDKSIIAVSINKNGFVCLIVKEDTYNEVMIFDNSGKTIDGYRYENLNIYPVTCAISEDNSSYVIGLVDIHGSVLKSSIAFHSIIEKKLIAAYDVNDSFVAKLEYSDKNKLNVFFDNQVVGLEFSNSAFNDTFKLQLSNKIESCESFYKQGFAIYYGEAFPNSTESVTGELIFYDLKGNEVSRTSINLNNSFLQEGKHCVIAAFDKDFFAFDKKGKEIWTYKSTQDVFFLQTLNNAETFLQVGKNFAEIISLNNSSDTYPTEIEQNDIDYSSSSEPESTPEETESMSSSVTE